MANKSRRGRYPGRSKRGGLNKDTQAKIMIAATLIVLGGIVFAYYGATSESSHISHNSADKFCRTDFLPEVTAIVIDHTDTINAVQKLSLEARLSDVARTVKKNGSLRFYSVNEDERAALKPEMELCNPGGADDVSQLTGNQRLAMKRYKEHFSSIVETELDKILDAETAQRSLIMRTVQAAAVSSFIGSSVESSYKRLIVVSDFLEHSPEFSLYKSVPSFDDFKNHSYWPSVKSDLRGVNVEIFYLHRLNAAHLQTPDLKMFWQRYFLEQGANSVNFVPIEG